MLVSLQCTRFSQSTGPVCLFLALNLLNHQLSSFSGWSLVPQWSTCTKSKPCSSLLKMSNYVSMPESRLCLLYSLWWSPFPPSCQYGGSCWYCYIVRLSQSHVQPHFGALLLFSEAGNRQFQSTVSIQANTAEATRESKPLLNEGTDCPLQFLDFGDQDLVERKGPHQTGEQSKQHQCFSLPGSGVLSMVVRPLMVSLRLSLYHHPKLLTGCSDTIGMGVSPMWNLWVYKLRVYGYAPGFAEFKLHTSPCYCRDHMTTFSQDPTASFCVHYRTVPAWHQYSKINTVAPSAKLSRYKSKNKHLALSSLHSIFFGHPLCHSWQAASYRCPCSLDYCSYYFCLWNSDPKFFTATRLQTLAYLAVTKVEAYFNKNKNRHAHSCANSAQMF